MTAPRRCKLSGSASSAMSQENVEIVRIWRAYNDGGIEAAAEYFAHDCVCEDVPGLPDRATSRGSEGAREPDRHFKETWGDLGLKPLEFIDAGAEVVVAVIVMRAHGRDRVLRSTSRLHSSTRSATAGSSGTAPLCRGVKPSKPPGFRSRRCRRRTWSVTGLLAAAARCGFGVRPQSLHGTSCSRSPREASGLPSPRRWPCPVRPRGYAQNRCGSSGRITSAMGTSRTFG